MHVLLLLMMVSLQIACAQTTCVCDSTETNCSSVFECVNCFVNVDDSCKLLNTSYTTLSDCLLALNSTSTTKMVDWHPGGNECRYSFCTTDAPFAVSRSNRTVYWKTCNKGCSKVVVTKHPDSYVNSWNVNVLFLNTDVVTCYTNCLPATSNCFVTHDDTTNDCTVYKGCGSQCSLGTKVGFTSFIIKCTEYECEDLTPPSNGAVDTSAGTRTGDTATYSCNPGYTIWGPSMTTCGTNGDGVWNHPVPTCEPDCAVPVSPQYGGVSYTSTAYHSNISYTCNPGYNLNGYSTNMCGTGGVWKRSMPTCDIIDCVDPPKIQNGSVSFTNTTFGSQAFYVCDLGFSITGPSVVTCSLGNTWGSSMPACLQIDCGIPAEPANGQVLFNTTTYDSIARYECDVGYSLNGLPAKTCGSDGNWNDSTVPSCAIVDCGNPATPDFGTVIAVNTTYNSNASYGCITGYLLSGPANPTCLATGLWSGTMPQCNIQNCGALSPPLNGQVDYNSTTYGEQAMYSCDVGFNISGPSNRACKANGAWSNLAPVCLSPGSITTTRRPLAPLYIMPCICYPNKTFSNMTESQILAYLVRETSIDTKNTTVSQGKLNCRPDPRMSSAVIGTVGIIILSTLGAMIVCFDLMTVCKRRS